MGLPSKTRTVKWSCVFLFYFLSKVDHGLTALQAKIILSVGTFWARTSLKEGPGFTFSCAAFFHSNCFVEPEINQVENKGHKNITCKHKTGN